MTGSYTAKWHHEAETELAKIGRKHRDFPRYVLAEITELLRRLSGGIDTPPPHYKPLKGDLAGVWEIRKRHPASRIYYVIAGSVVHVLLCDPNKGGDLPSPEDKDKINARRQEAEAETDED